ncbi:sensor histidine kinase [Alkalihalobacterium bogoriense]|uniref:sensor histidine kinase n=1 Tax=Alkalihalobacterium bogoriense TaxID=246272 RepID=UPI00047EBB43|nr:sensor histidine kinase [Alkalihalobacterium bogoriense]
MNKIKTKLMLFFVLLFLTLNSLSLFLFINHKQTVEQYDHILNRFFLLNDISQISNEAYDSMNTYLIKKTPEDLEQFYESRQQLKLAQARLDTELMNTNNYVIVKNYQRMIESLIEESDMTIGMFMNEEIERYSVRQAESLKLLGFIQENTLNIVNDELTQFHSYYEAMNHRNHYMQSMGFAMFSGTFFMGFLFALLFSNGITRPINRLTAAAREIAGGKLDGKELVSYRNDELGFLTSTFNKMRKDLVYLVRQIKDKSEQDKLVKEIELKSLQSQINPHFLFNTLNTIAKLAYIEGSEKVYQLINSISKLLRYNLSRIEEPVLLEDEIKVVEEYFFIQKTRFGERVNFSVNVDYSCRKLRIPILTLQPLVENAFIHGIEPLEKEGHIEIEAYIDNQDVLIKIRDNGIGMTDEVRASFLDQEKKHVSTGHSTGLGLGNVIRRLQLYYQREDVFTIYSKVHDGTVIELRLPKSRIEGDDVDV